MKSVGQMIKQLSGLVGTSAVNSWEAGFITNICWQTKNGDTTAALTPPQVTVVEEIFSKHFQ